MMNHESKHPSLLSSRFCKFQVILQGSITSFVYCFCFYFSWILCLMMMLQFASLFFVFLKIIFLKVISVYSALKTDAALASAN